MEGLKATGQDKQGPIGEVETRVAELKNIASDVLETSMAIEDFLLGPSPIATSEKADKKQPAGWLQLCCDNLDEIRMTLNLAMNCIRTIKNISK